MPDAGVGEAAVASEAAGAGKAAADAAALPSALGSELLPMGSVLGGELLPMGSVLGSELLPMGSVLGGDLLPLGSAFGAGGMLGGLGSWLAANPTTAILAGGQLVNQFTGQPIPNPSSHTQPYNQFGNMTDASRKAFISHINPGSANLASRGLNDISPYGLQSMLSDDTGYYGDDAMELLDQYMNNQGGA